MPDVTVVVIGYNDVENISTAVESVLGQTLHNLEVVIVDDASTDGTGEIADRLAAEHARVRAVHLPENSGGCSRPRNVGMEHARAPYVMFLDSDDVYERHACKNLLLEAERTGADMVAGQCVRIFLDRDREDGWFTELYAERATYAGVRENPELFFDPLSTNKIYRRQFLEVGDIRFPEGVHYEDSLFSTKVYCQANLIAVIPNVVYFWNVVKDAEAKSITQRRFEFDNFRDRIAVHRMMDDYLVTHGGADLKVYKDFKFIRHDLRLYLNDLPARDYEYQRRFVRLAADYLATISEKTFEMLDPVQRICVHMLRRRDIEETLKTIHYLRHGYKLSTELVERDGRIYWSAKYLDTPEDRTIMDVTEMGLHRMTFPDQVLFNEITKMDFTKGRLQIEGRLRNQFRRIAAGDDLTLTVKIRNRGRALRRAFPATVLGHDGPYIRWRCDVPLTGAIGPLDQLVPVWDIRMDVCWNGAVNNASLSIDIANVSAPRMSFRGRFGGLAHGVLEPYVTIKGNLSFVQAPDKGVVRVVGRLHALLQRAKNSLKGRLLIAIAHPGAKRKAYHLFQRLPVKRGLVVFESHLGKQFSDSPKYIFEAAKRAGFAELGIDPVWSFAGVSPNVPAGTRVVRRNSWRHSYLLARAEYWIDNQGLPRMFTRRRETTYIQTWHGTPLKRMGFDSPELEGAGPKVRRDVTKSIQRWTALLVPSEYFVETFVASYAYEGELLRVGLPRNDLLVKGVDDDWVSAKRRELNIPADRKIALYAPTFRDRARRTGKPYALPFDLDAVGRALGDEWYVLVRTHYLDSVTLTQPQLAYSRDVSGHDDITELLLLADVLVTDYSSVMFDFANQSKPMIFFTYDYADYVRDERGTYFDLTGRAPGPLASNTAELVRALREVDVANAKYADLYADFRATFCSYETGRASEAVVERFFQRPGGVR